MMVTKNKSKNQSKSRKKSYSSPELTHFGTIKELTSGGSGVMAEGAMGTALMKHP